MLASAPTLRGPRFALVPLECRNVGDEVGSIHGNICEEKEEIRAKKYGKKCKEKSLHEYFTEKTVKVSE